MESYDKLLFQESKTDEFDILELPEGYLYYAKHRNGGNNKSGGDVVVYKQTLSKYLKFIETECQFVLWVNI